MRAIYLSLWTGSFGVTDEQAILLLVVVVLMAPKKIPPPNSSATTNVRVPIFFFEVQNLSWVLSYKYGRYGSNLLSLQQTFYGLEALARQTNK